MLFFTTNDFVISSNVLQVSLHHSSLQTIELVKEGNAIDDVHENRNDLNYCSEWADDGELDMLEHLLLCLVFYLILKILASLDLAWLENI
jgi:hypothetical protein